MKKTSNFSHYWLLILMEGILGIEQGKNDAKFLRNDCSQYTVATNELLCDKNASAWVSMVSYLQN